MTHSVAFRYIYGFNTIKLLFAALYFQRAASRGANALYTLLSHSHSSLRSGG